MFGICINGDIFFNLKKIQMPTLLMFEILGRAKHYGKKFVTGVRPPLVGSSIVSLSLKGNRNRVVSNS